MVSVIIPVYKVETYIWRCACSLLEQTFDDIEYIFIDDATPDASMSVLQSALEKYPHRRNSVRIIRHEKNKGLPAARNSGLSSATGEYIFHCDSDDYIEPHAIEKMYITAAQNDADIVWCDWYLTFSQNERYMRQPAYTSAKDALKGILLGKMKYNVWNKLVRRSLYTENNISFPDGHGMGEDMTMIKLFACAKKVSYLPQAFYHYVKTNTSALTSSFSEKQWKDVIYNTENTTAFIQARAIDKDIQDTLEYFKLSVKFPLLISDDRKSYEKWRQSFTEADKYILKDKESPLRNIILQYMAYKGHFWYLSLYYKMIYKLIYGVIYK